MNSSLFDQFRLSVLEKNLGVYGINVYQKGKGSLSHRFRSDDRVCIYSVSKTFTSVAVGICLDEGRFKLEDKVISFFPEYEAIASAGSEQITLKNLLHMSSGKEVFMFSVPVDEHKDTDWVELFFRDPVISKPGEKFLYANSCTYMLGRVVEKVSGQILREFLMSKVFDPFGIYNPQWETCPMGHTLCASGLYLTTNEMANIGKLLLHKGEMNGKRIVSENYVNSMYEDIISTGAAGDEEGIQGYGYQIWRSKYPGAYRADGLYGQFSIVIPDKEAVVTVTAHNEVNAYEIVRSAYRDIVSRL